MKEFARRLLAYEAQTRRAGSAEGSTAFRVCEQLRHSLTKLMGARGFHALFSRALVLASVEVPWLRSLQVKDDGSLQGVDEVEAKLDDNEIAAGEIALVAQLIGLLATFIGPALTLGLIREVWPKAAFDETIFEGESP